MAFFQTVFLEDEVFSGILENIEMVGIEHEYTREKPDEFTLTLMANVVVKDTELTVSSRDAAVLMGGAKFDKYLHNYVRRNKAKERNIFFQVEKVRFKGVGNGHQTS